MIPDNNLPIYFQNFTATMTDGSIRYTTVGLLPSNQYSKRIASIIMQGSLSPPTRSPKHTITLDFRQVAALGEINLEGPIDGLLTIGKENVDASSFMTYDASRLATDRILTLTLCHCASLARQTRFYFNITIDDTACSPTGVQYSKLLEIYRPEWDGDSSATNPLKFTIDNSIVNYYEFNYAKVVSTISVGPLLSTSNGISTNYLSVKAVLTIGSQPLDFSGTPISDIYIRLGNYEYIIVTVVCDSSPVCQVSNDTTSFNLYINGSNSPQTVSGSSAGFCTVLGPLTSA